jgi:ribonuclease inhibitor
LLLKTRNWSWPVEIQLDGARILSEEDFHRELALVVDVGPHYGFNLDALWDLLSANVERPFELVWEKSQVSQVAMPETFEEILKILEQVKRQDERFGWDGGFKYEVR